MSIETNRFSFYPATEIKNCIVEKKIPITDLLLRVTSFDSYQKCLLAQIVPNSSRKVSGEDFQRSMMNRHWYDHRVLVISVTQIFDNWIIIRQKCQKSGKSTIDKSVTLHHSNRPGAIKFRALHSSKLCKTNRKRRTWQWSWVPLPHRKEECTANKCVTILFRINNPSYKQYLIHYYNSFMIVSSGLGGIINPPTHSWRKFQVVQG